MKFLFVSLVSLLVLSSCDNTKKVTETVVEELVEVDNTYKMNNNIDSLSYAVGLSIAENFKQQNIVLNGEALARAIQDLKDNNPAWNPQLANQYIQTEIKRIEDERSIILRAEGEKWLANNAKKTEVKTTVSGLQYMIVKEGTGAYPIPTDKVTVHYTGTLTDGTKFDSSVDRGEPATFGLNQVIKGWTEGLQLVKEGGKIRLFIPQELAYGSRATGSIPAYSALIFDVELIKIVKE